MQRFDSSALEMLELYLTNIGFTSSSIKTDYQDGRPPFLSLTIGGRGDLEALNTLLRTSPFLVTDMQTRQTPDGHTVRLKMTQRRVTDDAPALAPEMGERGPVYAPFEPEMGE